MNKKDFLHFAISHSDRESLEVLINNMIDEVPMIREQLWDIYTDDGAGFVIKENSKLFLHPRFKNNGKNNGKDMTHEIP